MKLNFLSILFTGALLYSCGSSQQQEESASETEMTEEVIEEGTEKTELQGALAELREDQRVFFVQPADGAELTSPFVVEFGVEGMEVEPAGEMVKDKGHHHIIINGSFVPKTKVVPADDTHIHYGQGQLSDTLNLEPGEYTLTMQFADGYHQSYGEQMSASINVTVK